MYGKTLDSFLQRIPSEKTGLRENVTQAFSIVDRFRTKAAEIKGDAKLSAEGKKAKLTEAMADPHAALAQLAASTKQARENVSAQKARFVPKLADESVLGEMRRAEIRDYLRARASDAERIAVALSGDAAIEDAILFAPTPQLTGVPTDVRNRLVEKRTAELGGAQLDAIASDERALDETASAIAVAAQFLAKEAA